MKKKLLSWFLAFVMLLGLMPGAAIAADESEEQVAQTLYAYWNSDEPELIEGNSDGCWIGDWGDNWGVLFYTDEDGTNLVPDTAAITFVPDSETAAGVVEVTRNGDNCWNVSYSGLGSGVLQTTVDGVVYERAVLSRLPYYGFSKETTIAADSYLPYDSTFTYSDTNNTFYFIVDADMSMKVVGASQTGDLNCSIDSEGKLVTFTIPTGVDVDGEYNIEFTVQNTYSGETWTWYSGINLASTARRIVGQSDYRDYGVFYENEDDTYDVSVTLNPDSQTGRVFYIRENGEVALAENYSVSSSDTNVMTVEKLGTATNTGNTIWNILAHDFGSANVVLTFDDGEVMTYPVHVVLPNRGFSTANTLTEQSYVSDHEFYYTDTNRTFYYVLNRDDVTISNVTLEGDLADELISTVSTDGKSVEFTVQAGVTTDLSGDIFITMEYQDGGTGRNGWSFDVLNGAPMLAYRYVNGSWDDWQEDEDNNVSADIELNPSNSHWGTFHVRSNGSVVALQDITSVVSGDTNVVDVEYLGLSDLGNPVYEIFGVDFGSTTITVTYGDGETMTMPVSVVLPNRGFSTADTLTEQAYIADREFYYTDTSRTFYYVINRDGLTASTVTLEGDLADALDYAISSDGCTVAFTVKSGVVEDLDGNIFITMEYQNGGTSRNGWRFEVLNGAPVLAYRYVNGSWDDLQENEDNGVSTNIEMNPNNSYWVSFHIRSNGSLAALQDVTSVVSSDTNVANVEYLGLSDLGNPVYEIIGVGFGATTITVTYGNGETLTMPVSVVLPNRGFSTTDTLTESSYISNQSFQYTDTSRTFYYVVTRDGETISNVTVEGDLANVLSYSISSDGCVATFTVQDGVTSDLYGRIRVESLRNGYTSTSGYGFWVENGSPRMVYRWAEGNRNDLSENLNSNTQAEIVLNPTYTHWVVFCLRSGSTVTALQNITSVVSSDTDVAAVSYMGQTDLGNPVYEIHGIGFGDATITVTYDGGQTLSMPVRVVLPGRGWSSASTMTEQSFVAQEFTYTTAAPTLYYVASDCTMTSFQLTSDCSRYADCFDIQLGTNSSGAYAAITVKSGAALPGDWWIRFTGEGTRSDGGSWSTTTGICFINGDAPQLGTPSELEWNVEYSWDGTDKSTRMGSVGFKRADSDQARYEIEYYLVGESVTVGEGNWGWGSTNTAVYFNINDFIYDDLPSGEYYFRIRARGDGYNYRSGDWVTSDTWTYTKPQTQLSAPTGLNWDDSGEEITMNWNAVEGAARYEVKVYYAQTKDGEKENWGSSRDMNRTMTWLWDDMIAQCGDGWYFFRVRAIPEDITQICNSGWSDFSYGFCLGDVVATVNGALDDIDTTDPNATVADVQQAVSNISKLDEALAADTDNSGTVKAIAQMEADLGLQTTVDTSAAPAGFSAGDVKVTGAALNIDTDTTSNKTATLEIKAVDENSAPTTLIPTQYENTIQFTMDIPAAKDTDDSTPGLQLAVPVKITLPIPGNINPAFLVVLHYKESTNEWEELSWPHVYQDESGKWFATFVVDSMSPFALVERQSTATVEAGKIMLDAYLPTTGGNVEFLCAVYSAQGQMLELVTLESHASEPVEIEVSEISEGMYLKLLSVNVGGGWLPVAKEQKVPVTLQNS